MREPALIFDFGNVVAFFDYLRVCEQLGQAARTDGRSRSASASMERGFADLLARFESGRCPPKHFAQEVMALVELKMPYHEFVDAWQDIFWLNEPVARLIERLKIGWLPAPAGLEHQRPSLRTLPAAVRGDARPARPPRSFARSRPPETSSASFTTPASRRRACRPLRASSSTTSQKTSRGAQRGPDRPALRRHADLDRRPAPARSGELAADA